MGSAFAISDCVNTIRKMNITLSELKLLVVLLWQFSSDEWTCVHTKTYINYGILVRCVIQKVITQTNTKTSSHLFRVEENQDCYYQLREEDQRETERKLKRSKRHESHRSQIQSRRLIPYPII